MAGHIFISYSKLDTEFAFRLADDLLEAGYRVWIDRQIEGGERWRTSISDALRNATEMIVVLSPRSMNSKWVLHEGSVASGLDKPIYPVLIEPIQDLPVWMEEVQYIDFHAKPYDTAYRQLIDALTPRNPLQDMLDQQVQAYRQTGEIIGEALLRVIDEERSTLIINDDAATLIERSKRAVTYRRRLVRASAGAAVALSVIALVAGIAAIRAGSEINSAQQELNTAVFEVTSAARELEQSETQVAVAVAQQATAQFNIDVALTEQSRIQAELATATSAVGLAEAEISEAEARIETAENQLMRLFETTGTVPVGDEPRAILWNGQYLWVANRDQIMTINARTGVVESQIMYTFGSTPPSALGWDGTRLWAALQELNQVIVLDPGTKETIATIDVGAEPTALAWDGGGMWVANRRDSTLQRITAYSPGTWEITSEVTVGSDPRTLLVDSSSRIWVANRGDNTVQLVDPATNAISDPIPVGERPAGLAWDGQNLWVANRNDSTIMQINPATGEIRSTLTIDKFPSALIWDGASIWVTNDGRDTVVQISPQTAEIVTEIDAGRDPRALTWDGQGLWVANFRDDAVVRVDVAQDSLLDAVPVQITAPTAFSVVDKGFAFASTSERIVESLDLSRTPPTTQRFTMSGNGPTGLTWAGSTLWAVREDGSIQQMVLQNGSLPARITPAHPVSAMEWDGENLWAASRESGVIFAINPANGEQVGREITVGESPSDLLWDGERLWVANSGDGTVMRVNTGIGLVWSPVTVGNMPTALAWDGDSLWVINQDDNTVTQVAPGGAILSTVRVGDRPVAIAWDGTSLWIANSGNSTVQQIDPLTATIQATIRITESPLDLMWTGEKLWVATELGTVQEINTSSLNLLLMARRSSLSRLP